LETLPFPITDEIDGGSTNGGARNSARRLSALQSSKELFTASRRANWGDMQWESLIDLEHQRAIDEAIDDLIRIVDIDDRRYGVRCPA
jgi:hypothetical protein